MSDLRLEPLDASNVVAANSLTLKPGQEAFATPTTYVEARGSVNPNGTWARVVREGDRVVGFIRGQLDPEEPRENLRSAVWSVNVAADAQGHGVGRFAVEGLADAARAAGFDRLTVVFDHGDGLGPEEFFLHLGFEIVGETEFGEAYAIKSL